MVNKLLRLLGLKPSIQELRILNVMIIRLSNISYSMSKFEQVNWYLSNKNRSPNDIEMSNIHNQSLIKASETISFCKNLLRKGKMTRLMIAECNLIKGKFL